MRFLFWRKPNADERKLAEMVYATWLLNDAAPLPGPEVRRWVNRTMGKRVFPEGKHNGE